MNIRTLLDFNGSYSHINREERNLAAILYYALFHNDNTQRFLTLIGDHDECDSGDFGIYFEYSFLRDLWRNIDKESDRHRSNELKRRVILELLEPANAEELRSKTILEFNTYFGCVPQPSDSFIQSPGKWSIIGNPRIGIEGFSQTMGDNGLFGKACRFKWAFNIKPDIVIHKSKASAVCIEAKLESREGHYPSRRAEEMIFAARGITDKITQTELQRYMMKELLGVRTEFVLLVKNPTSGSDSHTTLTWREAFRCLDTSGFHPFLLEWIDSHAEPRHEVSDSGEDSP